VKEAKAGLIAIGPMAEGAVAKSLKHERPEVRLACCEILSIIGTKASIASLRPLVARDRVGEAARTAIGTINRRAVEADKEK